MPAAGAQSGADGNLATASRSPRQHQAGDVRAGDQQHEADRAQQHQHGRLGIAGDEIGEGQDKHAPGRILGIGAAARAVVLDPLGENSQQGAGLLKADAGLEAGIRVVALVESV